MLWSLLWFAVYAVLLALLLAVVGIGYQYAWAYTRGHYATANKLPHPPLVPILGNLYLVPKIKIGEFHYFLEKYYRQFRGNWYLQIAHRTLVMVCHPEDVAYVVGKGNRIFIKDPFYERNFGFFLGRSMLLSNGEEWMRQRKLLNPAFSNATLDHVQDVVHARARILVDHLLTLKPDQTLEMGNAFQSLTLDVLGLIGFGFDLACQHDANSPYFNALGVILERSIVNARTLLPLWTRPYTAKQRQAVALLRDTITSVYRHRIAHPETIRADSKDILSLMLKAKQEGNDWITETEIRDEMMLFMFAGSDTTSFALTAVMYALSNHPDVLQTLLAEIDTKLGDKPFTMKQVQDLPYLNAVVNEALRLWPSAPVVSRSPTEDVQLPSGFLLPREQRIVLSTWVHHRNPELWGDDADLFRPARWLAEEKKSVDNDDSASKKAGYRFLPFLMGHRNCIGQNLALMELRIVVAAILQKCTLHTAAPVRTDDLEPVCSLGTLKFAAGMPMHVKPRVRRP